MNLTVRETNLVLNNEIRKAIFAVCTRTGKTYAEAHKIVMSYARNRLRDKR